MKFASKDGQFLELRILGYEFPHIETAEYDSNWLIVAGNVTNSRGSWQFTHPCLLTYEAERLASWMVALVEIDRFPTTCGFIEPNLEFRALLNMNRPCFGYISIWKPGRYGRPAHLGKRLPGSSFRSKSLIKDRLRDNGMLN